MSSSRRRPVGVEPSRKSPARKSKKGSARKSVTKRVLRTRWVGVRWPHHGSSADEAAQETDEDRNVIIERFVSKMREFALSKEGLRMNLYALTLTYPRSTPEDLLYARMYRFAKRVEQRKGDALWVVAGEEDKTGFRKKIEANFHFHGIAASRRPLEWFKTQWLERSWANPKAIKFEFVHYQDDRPGEDGRVHSKRADDWTQPEESLGRFERSLGKWISYICRRQVPSLNLSLRNRVIASGPLRTVWRRASGHKPMGPNFEPHSNPVLNVEEDDKRRCPYCGKPPGGRPNRVYCDGHGPKFNRLPPEEKDRRRAKWGP